MDPVYDKWVRHSPLLGRACNYTETIDFKVVPCWPGLNQHDQLDKDEWFSARGAIFSPGCLGISPKLAPFPPAGVSSPRPHLVPDFSTLIWINWSGNYAGPTW